jgi:hydrogenase maturation factor HypF (carbamoyltransferase family)
MRQLLQAADAIRKGMIVAVKGIGGFHLMADPFNDKAVRTLRERKHREEKPFALLMPTITEAERYCEVSELEMKSTQFAACSHRTVEEIEERNAVVAADRSEQSSAWSAAAVFTGASSSDA